MKSEKDEWEGMKRWTDLKREVKETGVVWFVGLGGVSRTASLGFSSSTRSSRGLGCLREKKRFLEGAGIWDLWSDEEGEGELAAMVGKEGPRL